MPVVTPTDGGGTGKSLCLTCSCLPALCRALPTATISTTSASLAMVTMSPSSSTNLKVAASQAPGDRSAMDTTAARRFTVNTESENWNRNGVPDTDVASIVKNP